MIRCLLARLCAIDWRAPFTIEAHGGGPALDRALDDRDADLYELVRWEQEIRADERRRIIRQADIAVALAAGDSFPSPTS